jgi:ankyrin repeat protein
MIGVNNGTALHRATDGDLAMIKRLVAKGADVNDRNNPFHATSLAWADHGKQTEIVQWMKAHCAIHLHDAVSFNLRDHAEARLREDPASVNSRIDQWSMPQSTPLHWAAARDHVEMAKLLLDRGADPNILAGDGLTALDVAEQGLSEGIVMLIEQRGGKRSAEM